MTSSTICSGTATSHHTTDRTYMYILTHEANSTQQNPFRHLLHASSRKISSSPISLGSSSRLSVIAMLTSYTGVVHRVSLVSQSRRVWPVAAIIVNRPVHARALEYDHHLLAHFRWLFPCVDLLCYGGKAKRC